MRASLDQYAHEAMEHLGPDTCCSVTLLDGSSVIQAGSNDPRAAACVQLEVEQRRGPCILAMEQLFGVVVGDTLAEPRWPSWASTAAASGFRSAVALPAFVDETTTVALNVYADRVDAWDVRTLIGMDVYVQKIADAIRAGLGIADP